MLRRQQLTTAILLLVSATFLLFLLPHFSRLKALHSIGEDYYHYSNNLIGVAPISQHESSSSSPSSLVPTIALVVVGKNPTDNSKYTTAIATMRCYAALQNYSYHMLYMDHHEEGPPESEWERAMVDRCLGNNLEKESEVDGWDGNFLFFRLCGVVEFMAAHPEYDYVLMHDADVGVINPQRRIEEFIDVDQGPNIYFYEREHTWDVSLASALLKNNAQSRLFLTKLVNLSWELPQQKEVTVEHLRQSVFADRDNGALHELLLQLFAQPDEIELCEKLILRKDFPTDRSIWHNLFEFQVCVNYHLSNKSTERLYPHYYFNEAVGHVKVLPKYTAWVRDQIASLIEKWNVEHDFMVHGWKEKFKRGDQDEPREENNGLWSNPFTVAEEEKDLLSFISYPLEVQIECAPEKREEVIKRFWVDRWRKELILSNEEFAALVSLQESRLLQGTKNYLASMHTYLAEH